MRGIILAGGSGTRLSPITLGTSRRLVPVYDKPIIYCPLSTLMPAHIQDVLVITTPHDAPSFHRLLGDGLRLGANVTYTVQEIPNGLTQVSVLGADHIDTDSTTLVLGDNIFYGSDMNSQLRRHVDPDGGAILVYHVSDPSAYGIVEFDKNFTALSTEEKPARPKSHYAVPGLYFYDNNVVDIARNLKPPARGEHEITDADHTYLEAGKFQVKALPRDTIWLDTGTSDPPTDATALVRTIEARQGMKIRASEEVAWKMGFVGDEDLRQRAEPLARSGYGQYLLDLLARDDI